MYILCPNDILDINWINICCYWDHIVKAANLKAKTQKCRRIYSRTTTWPYPNGVIHTWDTNGFFNCACAAGNEENPKTPYYWPFVMGIQRRLLDSSHKVHVICKVYPCLYAITAALVSRAYKIAAMCGYKFASHTNDVTLPYDIIWYLLISYGGFAKPSVSLSNSIPRHIAISYVRLMNYSVWHKYTIAMPYGGGVKSSIWVYKTSISYGRVCYIIWMRC